MSAAPEPSSTNPVPDITRTTPHIDPAWRKDFILEQRLAGVPGDRIGDALATVDAHCADSGQSAAEAFGDPIEYARATSDGSVHDFALGPRAVVGLLLGVFGLLTVPRAVDAWAKATPVAVSGGDLVAAGLCLGVTVLVVLWPTSTLMKLVRCRSLVFVLPFGLLAVFLLPQLLWREPVVESSWPLLAGAGVLALTWQVVLAWPSLTESDPIQDPRAPAPDRPRRSWGTTFLFPLLTVMLLAVGAVFRALS